MFSSSRTRTILPCRDSLLTKFMWSTSHFTGKEAFFPHIKSGISGQICSVVITTPASISLCGVHCKTVAHFNQMHLSVQHCIWAVPFITEPGLLIWEILKPCHLAQENSRTFILNRQWLIRICTVVMFCFASLAQILFRINLALQWSKGLVEKMILITGISSTLTTLSQ